MQSNSGHYPEYLDAGRRLAIPLWAMWPSLANTDFRPLPRLRVLWLLCSSSDGSFSIQLHRPDLATVSSRPQGRFMWRLHLWLALAGGDTCFILATTGVQRIRPSNLVSVAGHDRGFWRRSLDCFAWPCARSRLLGFSGAAILIWMSGIHVTQR